MIFNILPFLALITIAMAAPISPASISGLLPSGAGFQSFGATAAGASADTDSGVSASGLTGIGNVFSLAGPGLALGGAMASPSM